ncbi:TetR/AcrR family transcriptional regulator [Microbacterium sp. No. 7]|uniref:TetR/AcrR family transcriptional regulator n=1 Tax=Microbacterium sp. No. 7 TaxID=1714373 RepID=UPI0006D15E73|nr:TetR family transcriptional regulator [Microbacterium sp. No. 7]ALJ18646.1 hypothetical protein AOA12_01435 [Microbacterium sp. No. 7]
MAATRATLTPARVIGEAIAIADASGLDAVSMRAVATRLGVVPMALYKHVSDKSALVGGMIDAVVAAYPQPPAGLPWTDAVRWRILAAREALGAHPWLRPAIEGATQRTPAVLAYMNALAGEFAAGGVSYDLAHHAMHALGHRIWGFSPEAFAPPAASAAPETPGTPDGPDAETLAAMAAAFPHVVAIAQEAAASHPSGACDADAEFVFTLDLLLDAFTRLHAAGWSSRG